PMVASQQSLSHPASNPKPLTAANPTDKLTDPRSDIQFSIADNLPPNYHQERDLDHGYRWFCVSQKTAFTVEIYLDAAKRRIIISVFDNRRKNIKAWNGKIRMTGNW